jgi:NAD(P)-dependent dehydrogenase (short-subunit alcohol dehydrogenase family)
MKDFLGKVAVITGAGSGIGRALAEAMAAEGAHLALVDVSEAGLRETEALVKPMGGRVTQHLANVADAERMQTLAADIEAQHGAIHLLFNNAGVTINKAFVDSSLADLHRVMDINLWGVLHGCHFFLPAMRRQPEAHIINTSSMAAFVGMPNQATYSSSKAAVRMISESLAAELAPYNIGVTCLHPGTISTNILKTAASHSGGNQAVTERMSSLMQRFGMPPERLAAKTLRAVRNKRLFVRIGIGAYILDWLRRITPSGVVAVFRLVFTARHRREATHQ